MRFTATRHSATANTIRNATRSRSVRLEAEAGVAHQLHQLVQRVELGGDLHALGQLVDREERAGDQEQRRDEQRRHVVELVDLRDVAATAIPKPAKPSAVMKQKSGTSSIPGAGSRPKTIDTISGKQP